MDNVGRIIGVKDRASFEDKKIFSSFKVLRDEKLKHGQRIAILARSANSPKGMPPAQIFINRQHPRRTSDLQASWHLGQPSSKKSASIVGSQWNIDHVLAVTLLKKFNFDFTEILPIEANSNQAAGRSVEKSAGRTGVSSTEFVDPKTMADSNPDWERIIGGAVRISQDGNFAYLAPLQATKMMGVIAGNRGGGYSGVAQSYRDFLAINALAANSWLLD